MKTLSLTNQQIDNLDESQLRAIAKSGKLYVMLTTQVESIMSVPNRDDFMHLTELLHLSAASRKYHLSKVTIYRWITSGLLQYVSTDKNRKLIRESDIAYLVARYRALGGSQGKRLM